MWTENRLCGMPEECRASICIYSEEKKFYLTFLNEGKICGLQCTFGSPRPHCDSLLSLFDFSSSFFTLQIPPLLPAILSLSFLQTYLKPTHPQDISVKKVSWNLQTFLAQLQNFSHSTLPYVAWLDCEFSEFYIPYLQQELVVPFPHTWHSLVTEKEGSSSRLPISTLDYIYGVQGILWQNDLKRLRSTNVSNCLSFKLKLSAMVKNLDTY
jgi:hypothetical protein